MLFAGPVDDAPLCDNILEAIVIVTALIVVFLNSVSCMSRDLLCRLEPKQTIQPTLQVIGRHQLSIPPPSSALPPTPTFTIIRGNRVTSSALRTHSTRLKDWARKKYVVVRYYASADQLIIPPSPGTHLGPPSFPYSHPSP